MSINIIKKQLITTKRLTIHPYTESDTDALVGLLKNPKITATFMVPDYESEEEYVQLARKLMSFSQPDDTKHLEYGIYLGECLIGFLNDCGYDDTAIEIGYVIHPDFWGCGYAGEAVTAILAELKEMGFTTVKAGYFTENTASLRVMEKCGMHQIDEEDEDEYRGVIHKCRYCEKEL